MPPGEGEGSGSGGGGSGGSDGENGPGGNRGGPGGRNPSNPMDNPPISPLALDLTGAGLELIARENSGAVFDLDGDGFATFWLGSGSGFLAHDVNGNGRIDDISELFGAAAFNGPDDHGFTMLAMHDLNGDGVIDANDAVFSELLIWRDFNGDGLSDAGELFTLAEMGIVSISRSTEAKVRRKRCMRSLLRVARGGKVRSRMQFPLARPEVANYQGVTRA